MKINSCILKRLNCTVQSLGPSNWNNKRLNLTMDGLREIFSEMALRTGIKDTLLLALTERLAYLLEAGRVTR